MPSRRREPAQPAKLEQPEKAQVPSTWDMLKLTFRQHCQLRHRELGFYARNEHDADHRLRADVLDHVHSEPARPSAIPTEEKENDNAPIQD